MHACTVYLLSFTFCGMPISSFLISAFNDRKNTVFQVGMILIIMWTPFMLALVLVLQVQYAVGAEEKGTTISGNQIVEPI